MSNATVGVGWSGYFKKFFALFDIHFADTWTEPTVVWDENPARIYYAEGHYLNVPGFVIIMMVTILLCIGYVYYNLHCYLPMLVD